MHSDHSAAFSGKVNGAEESFPIGAGATSSEVSGERTGELIVPQGRQNPRNHSSTRTLSREELCGLTIIVGGTNVRFSISHLRSNEPVHSAVKWQFLRDRYNKTPEAQVVEFANSHDITYPELARHCEKFLRNQFKIPKGPIKLPHMTTLYVSVAGLVEGDGFDATVTTTNTLLKMRQEHLATKLHSALVQQMPGLLRDDLHVRVLNDAQAGLEGEIFLNKIDPQLATLFLIFGTGFGSSSTVPGFAELGHLIVYDLGQHKYRFLTKEEMVESRDTDGSYKPLKGLIYAENLLAGPWVAIGFVKCIARHHPTLTKTLAEYIAKCEEEALKKQKDTSSEQKAPRSIDAIMEELKTIRNFKSGERTQWAGHANSVTLGYINKLIFDRDHCDLGKIAKTSEDLHQFIKSDEKLGLLLVAERKWKAYFEIMGKVVGVAYSRMLEEGINPHKFIAGGGIGELCNRYNDILKNQAVDTINRNGSLPPGLLKFSEVSPEARESAPAHRQIEKDAEAMIRRIDLNTDLDPALV